MTRKRITLNAIEKIEQALDISCEAVESAVFGICDLNRNVIKRLRMTADGVSETNDEPTILIPQKLEKLLYPKRIKVIYGGRGSGKTRTVTSILTERARFKRERVACFREIQASIKESSYQEIADEIERKNEGDEFRQVDGEITHKLTRSKFSFKGLYRNLTTVKGFAGATIAWVEEAENISQTSIDILEPTIRAPGSEIWLTFNPNKPTDAIWTNFVEPYLDRMVDGVYEDDETLIIEVNYVDNPWFTEELEMTRKKAMRTDLDRYNWIWLGRFNKRSDELVLGGKYVVQDFTPTEEWDGPYLGADFGFAQDPSTLVVCWVYDGILYVEHEGYGSGVEIDQLGAMYERAYPRAKEYVIRADCSRPETISYVARQGFKIEGCEKWSGSVEDGVTHLRSYERIAIHSRCKHAADEAARYSYKVDKNTGDVLPDIVDKHNHVMDAIRYAIGPLIKRESQPMLFMPSRYR